MLLLLFLFVFEVYCMNKIANMKCITTTRPRYCRRLSLTQSSSRSSPVINKRRYRRECQKQTKYVPRVSGLKRRLQTSFLCCSLPHLLQGVSGLTRYSKFAELRVYFISQLLGVGGLRNISSHRSLCQLFRHSLHLLDDREES